MAKKEKNQAVLPNEKAKKDNVLDTHFGEGFSDKTKLSDKEKSNIQKKNEKIQKQVNKEKAKENIVRTNQLKQDKRFMRKIKSRSFLSNMFSTALGVIFFIPKFIFQKIKQMLSPSVYMDKESFRDAVADEMRKQMPVSVKVPESELTRYKEQTKDNEKESVKTEPVISGNEITRSFTADKTPKDFNIIEKFEQKYGKTTDRSKMFDYIKELKKEGQKISLDDYCKAIGYATNSAITFDKNKNSFICHSSYEKRNKQKMINFEVDKDFVMTTHGLKNNNIAKYITAVLQDNFSIVKDEDIAEINIGTLKKEIQKELDENKSSDVIELFKGPAPKEYDETRTYQGETMEIESELADDIFAEDFSKSIKDDFNTYNDIENCRDYSEEER